MTIIALLSIYSYDFSKMTLFTTNSFGLGAIFLSSTLEDNHDNELSIKHLSFS